MQALAVALIVLAAAGYAGWYWMPRAWRRALAARLGRRQPKLAALSAALARDPGCGACESCGTCDTPAAAPGVVTITPPERRRDTQSPTP